MLGCPLLGIVVDVNDTEAGYESRVPFKVVHERPGEIGSDIYAVLSDGLQDGIEVAVVVSRSCSVIWNVRQSALDASRQYSRIASSTGRSHSPFGAIPYLVSRLFRATATGLTFSVM